jgi:hypothetical protein
LEREEEARPWPKRSLHQSGGLRSCAVELEHIRRSRDAIFKAPPRVWIEERVATMQNVLEKKTQKSALLLRKFLGKVQLKPTKGDIGRPYYVAKSNLRDLVLLEEP